MPDFDSSLLFPELPVQAAPLVYRLNLYELVPLLLNDYPRWKEQDILEFVEEKTGQRLHAEDQITLRAVYQRCLQLEAEFQEVGSGFSVRSWE